MIQNVGNAKVNLYGRAHLSRAVLFTSCFWRLALVLLVATSWPVCITGTASTPSSAEAIVGMAYRGVLGREPDAGGKETYVNFLAHKSKSVSWLCTILCTSDEFKNYTRQLNYSSRAVARQLHGGIEGCIDEGAVARTQQLIGGVHPLAVSKRAADLISEFGGWNEQNSAHARVESRLMPSGMTQIESMLKQLWKIMLWSISGTTDMHFTLPMAEQQASLIKQSIQPLHRRGPGAAFLQAVNDGDITLSAKIPRAC